MDGGYGQWTSWGPCTTTCGGQAVVVVVGGGGGRAALVAVEVTVVVAFVVAAAFVAVSLLLFVLLFRCVLINPVSNVTFNRFLVCLFCLFLFWFLLLLFFLGGPGQKRDCYVMRHLSGSSFNLDSRLFLPYAMGHVS